MYGICIESSPKRGMGHLFRQINFASFLKKEHKDVIFFVNDDLVSQKILSENNIRYELVELLDFKSKWEKSMITRHGITVWIDDRLDTDIRHTRYVKETDICLVVFDDKGGGASLADFNFSALSFDSSIPLSGKKIFTGEKYLILNPEIESFKHLRSQIKKIIVTLGGSDTYNVTSKVIDILKNIGREATIVVGPSFDRVRLQKLNIPEGFVIKQTVQSLVAEFSNYDIAICGGGITPFEANAAGLPCIIIATELFEIPNAKYLEHLGSSLFAGYRESIDMAIFRQLSTLKITEMSQAGLSQLDTMGAQRVYDALTND